MSQLARIRGARLPADIIYNIAGYVRNFPDFINLASCSKATYSLLQMRLWVMDTQLPGKPALYGAIERDDISLAKTALFRYIQLGARGMLDGSSVQWATFTWKDGYPGDQRPASPVTMAVERGTIEMLRVLVNAGCSLDMRLCLRPVEPYTWYVHEHCDVNVCRGRYFTDWDSQGLPVWQKGFVRCETALHSAVWAGRPDMLRLLLENGAKVEGPENDRGEAWECVVPLFDTFLAKTQFDGAITCALLTPLHLEMQAILAEYGIESAVRAHTRIFAHVV